MHVSHMVVSCTFSINGTVGWSEGISIDVMLSAGNLPHDDSLSTETYSSGIHF